MKTYLAVLGFAVLSSAAAEAREFGFHATRSMSVRGVPDQAVRLSPGVAGWYLTLDVPTDGSTCRAELRDVSPMPGALLKWVESVPNVGHETTVQLDPSRYIGSHTYRMTLRCGMRELAHGLVHLLPPSDYQTLRHFDLEQRARNEEGSDIAITPKGAL